MISKEQLIKELSHNTYVQLKSSPVAGVGVFAIRDIPRGCREMFGQPDSSDQWITLTKEEVSQLPEHSQHIIYNYCLFDDESYFVPAKGFKKMDLTHYINHSDSPNIQSISDGDFFEALRDIKAGEELFVDYGTIVDGEE